jgi:hypothetical protein
MTSRGSTFAIPEPELFPVEHEVTQELREALKKRHEGYGDLPANLDWRRPS